MISLRDRLFALSALEDGPLLPARFYQESGFSSEDARALIDRWGEHGLEDGEEDAVDAALVHAWTIIARFGGTDGRTFLLERLDEAIDFWDDFFLANFAELMVASGPEGIPELIFRLQQADGSETGLMEIAQALAEFVKVGIEGETCLAALVATLQGSFRHRSLKAVVIISLVELTQDRYIGEIRRAYEANLVDLTFTGDLEELEVQLGLRSQRATPKPNFGTCEAEQAKVSFVEHLGPVPLDGSDADIIAYFLKLYESPSSAKDVAELDGLLLGVILAPNAIKTSDWLSAIWDPERLSNDPNWENEQEAQQFFTAVMSYYNGIIQRLDEGSYSPPIKKRTDPRVPTDGERSWSSGLLSSVLVWRSGAADSSELHQALMAAALFLAEPTDETADKDLIQVDHVVRAVIFLRQRMTAGGVMEYGTYQREEPKIGRNDPCACGSGLKYKRCCMN